jgi:hypothetical protein
MTFTGLPTLQLLGLGLVSFLVIFGLYRLRDRRPTTTVASLEIYRELTAQHLRRRSLRQLLSILVQLLILTLLLLALSEPERRVSTERQRHVLVLFDSSASMQVNEGTVTRFELAQKRLLNFIESLEPNTEVLLATIDSALTPQLPWTTDRNALRAAVKELKALPLPSRVQTCLESASSYLAGKSEPELLLVTDATKSAYSSLKLPTSLSNVKRHALLVGERQDNVAILGFAPRRRVTSPADTELLLTIGNFGSSPQRFTVEIWADEQLVHSTKWSLLGFETKSQTQLLTLAMARRLRASVHFESARNDALTVDNEAYAWLGSPRRSRLLVRTPGDLYLEAAVLSDPWLTPTFLPEGAPEPTTPQDASILNGGPLPRPLKRPTLWLNPVAGSSCIAEGKPLQNVGFDTWDRQHPMLGQLELYDVQIATARRLKPMPGDHVLAKSGNTPLLLETKLDGMPLVILGFDPKQSDFVLRPAWPLFIEQVTSQLLGTENVGGTAALSGIPVTLTPLHANGEKPMIRRVRTPEGSLQLVTVNHGQLTLFPEQLGFYEILADDDITPNERLAVNLFSIIESQVAPNKTLFIDSVAVSTPKLSQKKEPEPVSLWLVIATLILLGLEWIGFHRRVTV